MVSSGEGSHRVAYPGGEASLRSPEDRIWPDNLSMRALVAWRWGLFLTEGKIGVLSVSSLFLTRVGVYVGACVCIRTHIHTLHRWGTRM